MALLHFKGKSKVASQEVGINVVIIKRSTKLRESNKGELMCPIMINPVSQNSEVMAAKEIAVFIRL